MSEARYQLRETPQAVADVAACAVMARNTGHFPQYVAAIDWIISELERTPLEFGESREPSAVPDVFNRCASVGRLFVKFMVDDEEKAVYIDRFHWSRKSRDDGGGA